MALTPSGKHLPVEIPGEEHLYRLVRARWYHPESGRLHEDAFSLRPIEPPATVTELSLSLTRSSLRTAQQTQVGWIRNGRGPGVAALRRLEFAADFDAEVQGDPWHVAMTPIRVDPRGQIPFQVRWRLAHVARMVLPPNPGRT